MSANVNPETGIRYGIISAISLDPEIVNQIQCEGRDVRWEDAKRDLEDTIRSACEGLMSKHDVDAVVDEALDRMNGDQWVDDEPIHEFRIDGVMGQTTWLGGALLVWVFKSTDVGRFELCSPCVPNACSLDSPYPGGYEGYDVPGNWRYKDG